MSLAVAPTADAGDDCAPQPPATPNPSAPRYCVAVPISSPDPRVPVPATGVYVVLSGPECLSGPTSAACIRILYQETNGCAGLQRTASTTCRADTKLAV